MLLAPMLYFRIELLNINSIPERQYPALHSNHIHPKTIIYNNNIILLSHMDHQYLE